MDKIMDANQAAKIADEISNPKTYGDESRIHEIFTLLRQHKQPLWMAPELFRPFWAIVKHADILEIERQNQLFINEPRTVLLPKNFEEALMKEIGTTQPVRSLVHIDDPLHQQLRALTQSWFMPPNLKKMRPVLKKLAKKSIDRMSKKMGEKMGEKNGYCDFMRDIITWYPLHVIMSILGVPEDDEARMMKLTQELFGGSDPDLKRQESEEGEHNPMKILMDFYDYFSALTEKRRKDPRDDVASVIANGKLKGEPLNHMDAMGYYTIIATAGHDTTSSTIAGGLKALIENPGELAKLRADMSLMPQAVEEMIRWVTPVQHFLRTATEDYQLRGQVIKKGEAVMLFYPSGNRDEEVFDAPFEFRIDRSPNKHLAFGFGVHLCLGMHLARMEIQTLFQELLPRLDDIEFAGAPTRVQSSFVSGVKTMPVKYRMH